MKTRLDKDVTYRIGLVYTENDVELSGSIRSGAIYDKTR